MRRAALSIVLAVLAQGCALQGGLHSGSTLSHKHVSYGAQVQAASAAEPFPLHLGWEVAGHAEHSRGVLLTTGVQLGGCYIPRPQRWAPGFVGHADWGFPVDSEQAGGYWGATAEVPLSLEGPHQIVDRNQKFQFLARRLALVPYARYRTFYLWDSANPKGDPVFRHDFSSGMALRMRLASDMF